MLNRFWYHSFSLIYFFLSICIIGIHTLSSVLTHTIIDFYPSKLQRNTIQTHVRILSFSQLRYISHAKRPDGCDGCTHTHINISIEKLFKYLCHSRPTARFAKELYYSLSPYWCCQLLTSNCQR